MAENEPRPELIDLAGRAASAPTSFAETLTQVNESIVRFGVTDTASSWHSHDDEDKFFLVLEGELAIDVENADTIVLGPHQAALVPKGTVHRPRAETRTVVVMVERST